MIQHNVFFKWKPSMSAADELVAIAALSALKDQIPGIVSLSIGKQNSPEGLGKGYHVGLSVQFINQAARDTYLDHPAHTAAVALFKPALEDVIVLDYSC
jgi:hypothetical protein